MQNQLCAAFFFAFFVTLALPASAASGAGTGITLPKAVGIPLEIPNHDGDHSVLVSFCWVFDNDKFEMRTECPKIKRDKETNFIKIVISGTKVGEENQAVRIPAGTSYWLELKSESGEINLTSGASVASGKYNFVRVGDYNLQGFDLARLVFQFTDQRNPVDALKQILATYEVDEETGPAKNGLKRKTCSLL